MDKLGVAILGLDHWYAALAMAPQVAASEHVQLVAVAHDDAGRAEQVARRNGATFSTTDYRAALDRPDVQIVALLYATDRNLELCREAAALGKHILSVKPMANDLASADAIAEAVRAAGVQFFPLDCQGRLNPERQRQQQWISEGRIGKPQRYTHTLHGSLPMPWVGEEGPSWWTDAARVPGGAWIDHAIYAIDTVRWLFAAEVTSAMGVVGNFQHKDLPVEDYGAATFALSGDAVALIEDTWSSERGAGFVRQEIIGSQGTITEEGWGGGRVQLRSPGQGGVLAADPVRSPAISPVDHLAACVRGETQPVATIADARANLAACLAFYRAAKNNTVEKL